MQVQAVPGLGNHEPSFGRPQASTRRGGASGRGFGAGRVEGKAGCSGGVGGAGGEASGGVGRGPPWVSAHARSRRRRDLSPWWLCWVAEVCCGCGCCSPR